MLRFYFLSCHILWSLRFFRFFNSVDLNCFRLVFEAFFFYFFILTYISLDPLTERAKNTKTSFKTWIHHEMCILANYIYSLVYIFSNFFSTNYKIRNNVVVLAVTQKKKKQNSLALVCILNHRISSTSQFVLLHFFYFKFPAFRVVLTFIVVWWHFFYIKIKSD